MKKLLLKNSLSICKICMKYKLEGSHCRHVCKIFQHIYERLSQITHYLPLPDKTLNNILSYVDVKCQLDATEVFIADLIACSTRFGHHYAHHQELCPVCRMLQHPANRTHNPQLHTRPATWKPQHQIPPAGSNHCIILLSSWWWAQWCPKHVEQAIRSAIKTSVASRWHYISTHFWLNAHFLCCTQI